MIPVATLGHLSPGRVRLRVRSRRGDGAYFQRVRERLSRVPGVRTLTVNPGTGSILVCHTLELEQILGIGKGSDLFELDLAPASASERPLAQLTRQFEALDRQLASSSGGRLDLPTAIFALLAGAALVQVARGNVVAPAATLVWYAATLLLLARRGPGSTPAL